MSRTPLPRVVVSALAAGLAACSTRHAAADAAPPLAPAVELRAAHGELRLALAPRAHGWEVRQPGRGGLALSVTAGGATLLDPAGATLAALAMTGPGGEGRLELAGGRRLRVTFPRPHGAIDVIDASGVAVLVAATTPGGGALGRDRASQIVVRARPEADRIVIEGRDGKRLGTVQRLPKGPDRDLAALLLASPTLDVDARAVLAAFVLSR